LAYFGTSSKIKLGIIHFYPTVALVGLFVWCDRCESFIWNRTLDTTYLLDWSPDLYKKAFKADRKSSLIFSWMRKWTQSNQTGANWLRAGDNVAH